MTGAGEAGADGEDAAAETTVTAVVCLGLAMLVQNSVDMVIDGGRRRRLDGKKRVDGGGWMDGRPT